MMNIIETTEGTQWTIIKRALRQLHWSSEFQTYRITSKTKSHFSKIVRYHLYVLLYKTHKIIHKI